MRGWLAGLRRRTPLAWRLLMKERQRLLIAVAGIVFADVLMFMQLGFEDTLLESCSRPQQLLRAELFVINPQFETVIAVRSFARPKLYQALADPAVESVAPLWIGLSPLRNPVSQRVRMILVFGVEPGTRAFQPPEMQGFEARLQALDTVVFDRTSRPEFGPIPRLLGEQPQVEVQVGTRRVQVLGLMTMGASFAADGNLLCSDSTFRRVFPARSRDSLDVGLVRLKGGEDPAEVQARLQARLGPDVKVLTRDGFEAVERKYWSEATPIGFIFGFGVAIGFVVGTVIVYQILYSDVTDHLPEYATLKAMGYTHAFLLSTILQEAVLLAVFGFIPAALLSEALYGLARSATMLPLAMTWERAILVFVLTQGMCLSSGALAVRKLRAADPAEIF